MKTAVCALDLLLLTLPCCMARAQVAPAATGSTLPSPGFQLPQIGGTLNYAVTASENVTDGFYGGGGVTNSVNLSGDLAYLSQSVRHPFSAVYAGALLSATNGQPTTTVQSLALSQVLQLKSWEFTGSDAVSYLPESPGIGFAGVPGLGDVGAAPPVVGPITGQGVLTDYATRVTNSSVLAITHRWTARASIVGSGTYQILRFTGTGENAVTTTGTATPAGYGFFDSNQALGSIGPTYQLNARSSVNGNYTYSRIDYTGASGVALDVEGVNGGYTRQWGRWLTLEATAGPQWTKIGGAGAGDATSTNVAVNAVGTIVNRRTTGTLSYIRGTNSGFGVAQGTFSDSVNSSLSRSFSRLWGGALTANYTRSKTLATPALPFFETNTFVSGVQGTRALSRVLSMYGSYNVERQSTGGDAALVGAFHGTSQIIGFGVTYAPHPFSLGSQ